MSIQIKQPFEMFFNKDGSPLNDGSVYIGIAGLNPETNPISIFSDPLLTTPIAQPLKTINGYISSNGNPADIYVTGDYSITVKDKNGLLMYHSLTNNTENNIVIGTIATLRLTPYVGQQIVSVTGYYTALDNIGVREYYWDAVSVEADNGGTIIQVTGVVTGRWKMKYSGAVNVKWFGATGDGIADDTATIQLALNIGTSVFIPSGKYKTSSPLIVKSYTKVTGAGNSSLSAINDTECTVIWKTTNTVDSLGYDSIISCHNGVMDTSYPTHASGGNMDVSNITLVGNRTTNPYTIGYGGSAGNNAYGIYLGAGGYNKFRNITVVNCIDAQHNSQIWLSEMTNIMAYGRIYQGAGTSTTYSNCEAGYNTIEGWYISASYSTLNSCASDGGAFGRYKFKDCNGLVVNSCGIEFINEGLGSGYDYTGLGMYIQMLGGNRGIIFNGFRAFDQITADSQAPTDFIRYISMGANDRATFINDNIDRQLPPHSTTDKAYKIFNIDTATAKLDVINPGAYLFSSGSSLRVYHNTYTGGATLLQAQSSAKESFTPNFLTGTTNTVTYAIRKGMFTINDDVVTINIHIYIVSKNGTGNITITGLPAGLVLGNTQIPVQVTNFSGVFVAKGNIDTAGVITLYNAESGANITDTAVPATPFCNVWVNASFSVGQ